MILGNVDTLRVGVIDEKIIAFLCAALTFID